VLEVYAMQVLECDAKKLLSRHAIASPPGIVAATPEEAEAAATRLGREPVFVKAQVGAGDRMSGGGIRAAYSAAEAKVAARALLGRKLVTSQTSPDGQVVDKVLVERGIAAKREFYLAVSIDPSSATVMITAADNGEVGVEQRAAKQSAGLERLLVHTKGERGPGEIAEFCGGRFSLPADAAESLGELIMRLHRAFIELDAGLIEINPLALTDAGEWVAIDAKLAIDDNAMFRHPDLAELGRDAETDYVELHAQRHQINFVQMAGDIGAVVNGAGLGLATLDMIRAAGGTPANFMDIRTTARSLDIAQGVNLVLDNPRTKVVLVNVFGGGMQPCDTIVEGLGIAYRRRRRMLPVVLRVTGNNEDLARLRLANFNLPSTECPDMWQAVTRAVAIAQGRA
jgi:succinyl-CoA synthetase beta subunit